MQAVETITLVHLGPVIAAVVSPMLVSVAAMMRYQHKDSTRTRELIGEVRDEARTLIGEARDEFRTLIGEATDEGRALTEHHSREHGESLKEVVRSLADARERLARIEGHFGIGVRPPDEGNPNTASGGAEQA